MELHLGNSVRKIVRLESNGSDAPSAVTIYQKPRKRRKGSKLLRSAEKAIRRKARKRRDSIDDYLRRHERSNQKKKDGWARDLVYNVIKAGSKGRRKVWGPK